MQCYLGKAKTKDAAYLRDVEPRKKLLLPAKREAITLLGVSLWGFELPRIIRLHEEDKAIYYENKIQQRFQFIQPRTWLEWWKGK